jgi:hypothetical protein
LASLRWGFLFFFILSIVGCVISPRRGSSGGGGGGGGTVGKLYVTNDSGNAILRFDKAFTATGNVTPGATISGSSTQLASPQYLFMDASNDRLFVANKNGGSILIFEAMSTRNGNVGPNRVVTSTSLATPIDVAVDKNRDLLYVADTNAILVFAKASSVNGLTSPARVIQTASQLTAGAILLDSTNDRLFAADPLNNAIDVFDSASTLSGTVPINRQLIGSNTQLSQPFGLQIDSASRLIVSNFASASITIYANAATINGNVGPASVISGSNTALFGPTQLAINTAATSGELLVADPSGNHVVVFTTIATLTGTQNIAPARNLTGSTTVRGVAIDTVH